MFFQNFLSTKEFLEGVGYISGYLPKLNRGLGLLVYDAHFQYIFPWKFQ